MGHPTVKKWLVVAFVLVVTLVAGITIFPILMFQSLINSDAGSTAGLDSCINYEVGSNISVNGLSPEKSANASILVQDAMRRGLGKDGAAIAVMAALTESGMQSDPGGDNWRSEPEYMWSVGMFQTKLWYHFKEAWAKPGGGYYPQSHPESIARAKAIALDPKQQSKWFYDRLSGDYSGTKSLAGNRWRTAPEYRGKPWMVAQKIEQSRFTNGSNYRATWNGSKGITPMQVVDAVLSSGVSEGSASGDGTTFTTLTTAFPSLEVGLDGKFVIPTPAGAKLGTSGYPVLRDQPAWISQIQTPNGGTVEVAKWAQAVFGDLFTRWQASDVLSGAHPLTKSSIKVKGWTPSTNSGAPSDYNSGTAVTITADTLRKSTLTAEETVAIQKIVRDMGGVLTWAGPSNSGTFFISPNLTPTETGAWATTATSLGQPPYFFVGDSIGRSMNSLLTQNLPQSTVDAADGRKTGAGITTLRNSSAAKVAKTWIVELGTNDGNNPAAFTRYIQQIMDLAGPRKVFWINTYRPESNVLGIATENNATLALLSKQYPNLSIIDWNSAASANLAWFANDSMKIHPNIDGKEALMSIVLAAVTGNGNSNVEGISTLCGEGTGQVSNVDYVVADGVTGVFTDNLGLAISGGSAAKNRALGFVGNPPSSCINYNCKANCLHITARAYGRGVSGWYDAFESWKQANVAGKAVLAIDPRTGEKNPEAFNIPIGALVYWNPQPNGHVATYVGDGKAVTNGDFGRGQNVYLVPMEAMSGYGTGYQGWAYPVWNG